MLEAPDDRGDALAKHFCVVGRQGDGPSRQRDTGAASATDDAVGRYYLRADFGCKRLDSFLQARLVGVEVLRGGWKGTAQGRFQGRQGQFVYP